MLRLMESELVPIYDARDIVGFDVETAMACVENLPTYGDGVWDAPTGSAVLVGYTMRVVESDFTVVKPVLKALVRWVVVVGVPAAYDERLAGKERELIVYHE